MLSKRQLETSEALWKARHTYRRGRVQHWQAADAPARVEKWRVLAEEASKMLTLRRKQLADLDVADAPTIIGWDKTGINPSNVFGPLGAETKVTTHYAASPRARTLAEGIRLTKGFDNFHRGKGWGGLSYHYLIDDLGNLYLGRSTFLKGAHVKDTNSGNIGVNFFCTTGDEPTKAQAETYVWLLANAHTSALPYLHRTDRDLRQADIRAHNAWPGQSTACPGAFTPQALRRIAN